MRGRIAVVLPLAMLLLASCGGGPSKEDRKAADLATIDSLETILFSDEGGMQNREAAQMLVRNYARFYQQSSKDSLAIDMLFKAAEVSMGLGNGRMAVKYFGIVTDEHPNYNKAPEALFLQAFCEENLNNDIEQAQYFYEAFIARFPEHALAADARFSIENLGKTDEELLRMFEGQNKADS